MRIPTLRVAAVVVAVTASSALLWGPSAQARPTAASALPGESAAQYIASGMVYTADGRPASGLCVTATGPSGAARGMTEASGRYSVALARPGSYVLRYRDCRSGALAATRVVAVTRSAVTPVPAVTMARSALQAALAADGVAIPHRSAVRILANHPAAAAAGIYGRVTSPSGHPLRNICVWLLTPGGAYGVLTARNGTYGFQAQAGLTGTYPIEFTSSCLNDPGFPGSGPWAPEWYKDKFSQAGATKVTLKLRHVVRNINAVMQRNGEVAGTVTSTSGRKLGGLCVVLSTPQGDEAGQATTAANGRYVIVGLDPGSYRALFTGCNGQTPDYLSTWWPNASSRSAARPILVRLGHVTGGINGRLARLGTISGTVRFRNRHGKPLAGICINALSPDPANFGGFATTSRNGTYTMSGLTPGKYAVFAFVTMCGNGNYAQANYPRPIWIHYGSDVSGVNMYMQPGGIISGTVTSAATGTPLQGICVGDDEGNFAVTSATGTYEIDQLSSEQTSVEFNGGCNNSGSYAPQWYPAQDNEATAETLTVRVGRTTGGVNAAMLPGATIAGHVTGRDGKSMGGVCVAVVPQAYVGSYLLGDIGAQVISGGSGDYSVSNLAPGDYAVAFYGGCAVNTSDAAQQWYPDQPTYATAGLVDARAGATVPGIDGAVSAGGTISGFVTDTSGTQLLAACVYAFNTKAGWPGSNDEFASGYNIAGLAPGRYIVEATSCLLGSNLASVVYKSPVTVRAGRVTTLADLVLPPGGSITGRITIRGSHAPARGVCVVASDSEPVGPQPAVTGNDGRYTITGLASGSYKITIQTTGDCELGGENLAAATLPARVHVTAGHVTTGVNASVGQPGAVSGRVTGPGGHDEPGMCVEVFERHIGLVSYTATLRSGQYLIAGLPPGRYDVEFGGSYCSYGPPGLATQWYDGANSQNGATAVTVTAGHVHGGVNAILGADGSLAGSVIGPGNAPLTGICVSAVPVSRYDLTVHTTATDGTYSLTGLQPGQYRVEFQSGCGLSGYRPQWWQAAGSEVKATVVTVGFGATVSGISAEMTK
jgi:uncharacterized protein (DUF2141 family)